MKTLRSAFFCLLLAAIAMPTVMAAHVGQAAPNCKLTFLDEGDQVAIRQWRGKVVYVDFWASWCPPCVKSFPFLNNLHQQFGDQGLQIVGVNLDEKLSDAQDFLAKFPIRFDIVTDPGQQCAKSFDVQAMPSSFLIDRNGVIRHIHLGFRSGDVKELRAQVQKVLREEAGY